MQICVSCPEVGSHVLCALIGLFSQSPDSLWKDTELIKMVWLKKKERKREKIDSGLNKNGRWLDAEMNSSSYVSSENLKDTGRHARTIASWKNGYVRFNMQNPVSLYHMIYYVGWSKCCQHKFDLFCKIRRIKNSVPNLFQTFLP